MFILHFLYARLKNGVSSQLGLFDLAYSKKSRSNLFLSIIASYIQK